jgi:hypothetical protein
LVKAGLYSVHASALITATCRPERWHRPYDRADKLQQFDKGWDEAVAKGWTVVSMKNDWKVIYP